MALPGLFSYLVFELFYYLNTSLLILVQLKITNRVLLLPDYTLYSGVHACWSEHSDSSFVYGFIRLMYGLGTMTTTTLDTSTPPISIKDDLCIIYLHLCHLLNSSLA